MASVTQEFLIPASPDVVWHAVRDVGNAHELFRGVLEDSRLDDDGARVATFANGAVVRELIVDVDDGARRLAYAAVEGPLGSLHHHSVMQVHAAACGSRVTWVTDVLPDELADPIAAVMAQGARAMTVALTGNARA